MEGRNKRACINKGQGKQARQQDKWKRHKEE